MCRLTLWPAEDERSCVFRGSSSVQPIVIHDMSLHRTGYLKLKVFRRCPMGEWIYLHRLVHIPSLTPSHPPLTIGSRTGPSNVVAPPRSIASPHRAWGVNKIVRQGQCYNFGRRASGR